MEPDGLLFDEETVVAEPIRLEADYGGIRILLLAKLGKAKIRIQVDIGFGDAVIPEAEESVYPTLLPFPAPKLRIYKAATVVAEKTHAMVSLGMSNSRMKDYFDIRFLSKEQTFQGEELVQALAATFRNRGTQLPSNTPISLTSEFGLDPSKQMQWKSFVRKMGGDRGAEELVHIVEELRRFLVKPMLAAAEKKPFRFLWSPGGPWVVKE